MGHACPITFRHRAASDDRALRNGVDFTISCVQWRHYKCTTQQAFCISNRRNCHINLRTAARKGRQTCSDQNGSHILWPELFAGDVYAKTLEYTKTREQFGVAIGSYQALQHRMVDTMMAYEQSKSLLFKALCEYKQDPAMAAETIHALKVLIDRNGKHVFGEAIQMHGGMGMTDELDIGHYAKRLMMINTTFGDATYHRNRYIETAYAA